MAVRGFIEFLCFLLDAIPQKNGCARRMSATGLCRSYCSYLNLNPLHENCDSIVFGP